VKNPEEWSTREYEIGWIRNGGFIVHREILPAAKLAIEEITNLFGFEFLQPLSLERKQGEEKAIRFGIPAM
jgi:hypothetical protein